MHRDLLKRHATLHTTTGQSGKKRKIRASQACSACATIKVKCDQEKVSTARKLAFPKAMIDSEQWSITWSKFC